MRARGGDVIPSFGGYNADHAGEEIADSCTDVAKIAADYEQVITTYNVTRLDFDVEDFSETNAPGIDRRNKAIALVEQWAAREHRTVQFVYTLGTNMTGLDVPQGTGVLQNAVAEPRPHRHRQYHDVRLLRRPAARDGQGHGHRRRRRDRAAAHDLPAQERRAALAHARRSPRWSASTTTARPRSSPRRTRTFVEQWAERTGIAELSFWALERDNGGCVGTAGS